MEFEKRSGCYLLQKAVDSVLQNNRYKIGKSGNIRSRMKSDSYQNADIICVIYLDDIDGCEKDIIKAFESKFERIIKNDDSVKGSFGSEIFAGNKEEVIKEFKNVCDKYICKEESKEELKEELKEESKEELEEESKEESRLLRFAINTQDNDLETTISILPDNIEILNFKYRNLKLEQNSYEQKFYLKSLEDVISTILDKKILVEPFMKTYMFYAMLALYDNSLHTYSNVYLIKYEDTNTFKVGKTYDFNRRYSSSVRKNVIRVVPVKNAAIVERKLLDYFRRNYTVSRGNEYFHYTNFDSVLSTFNAIVGEYGTAASFKYKDSSLINSKRLSKHKPGLWISKEVCQIIFRHFIEDASMNKDLNDMLRLIEISYKDESYAQISFNTELNTRCTYWKYHKYTVIQNESDGYVNGSRLFNSIKKAENKGVNRKLKAFLDSPTITRISSQFRKKYGDNAKFYYFHDNKSQPYFKGYYVHYILVHYIVDWLSADYSLMVAELMFNMFKNHSMSGGGIVSEVKSPSGKSKEDYIKQYMSFKSKRMDFDALCRLLED